MVVISVVDASTTSIGKHWKGHRWLMDEPSMQTHALDFLETHSSVMMISHDGFLCPKCTVQADDTRQDWSFSNELLD